MVRVEINNFQSIAHQVIEIESFSAIVGRSNIGKSAVVRAIKAALTGSPVDSYVRHAVDCPRVLKGAKSCKCFCSVRIVSEGLDLLWEKGDAINRYVFNGEEHTVAGRGTPEFLGEAFQPVKVGTDKKLIQVSDQFTDSIFLLNQSGTVVADVLSDVAKLDEINKATRMANKDKKDANATRKVREKDVKDLQTSLTLYEGLDEAVESVAQVELLEESVEVLKGKIVQLTRFVESVRSSARRVKALEGVSEVEVPEFDVVANQADRFGEMVRLAAELHAHSKELKSLSPVEKLALPDIEAFKALGTRYQKLQGHTTQLKHIKTFFERAKEVSKLEIPEISHIVNKQEDLKILTLLARKHQSSREGLEALSNELKVVAEEEKEARQELDALGVCPTCCQPLTQYEIAHA